MDEEREKPKPLLQTSRIWGLIIITAVAGFLIGMMFFKKPWNLPPAWGDVPTWLLVGLAAAAGWVGFVQLAILRRQIAEEVTRNQQRDLLVAKELEEAERRAKSERRQLVDGVEVTFTGKTGYVVNNSKRPINDITTARSASCPRRRSGRSSPRSPGSAHPPASASAPQSSPSASGPSGTTCSTPAPWTVSAPSRSPGRCPARRTLATSRLCSARSVPGGRAKTYPWTCCGTGYCSRPPTSAAPAPRRSARCHVEDLDLRIDDEHARIHGKGGTVRTVLLDDRGYVALLRLYLARSGYTAGPLFCASINGSGGPLSYDAAHNRWKKYRAAAGAGIGIHQLRHAHATELVNSGVSIEVVRRRLGHASTETTQVYTLLADKVADTEIRAARRKRETRR